MNNSAELPPWSRLLAIVTAVVFFVSSVFPVAAGLTENTAEFSKWWGILDVGIAFVLVILAFVIMSLTQGKVDKQVEDITYRAYRVLIHVILAMIVVFFLSEITLPGLIALPASGGELGCSCTVCPLGSPL